MVVLATSGTADSWSNTWLVVALMKNNNHFRTLSRDQDQFTFHNPGHDHDKQLLFQRKVVYKVKGYYWARLS